MNPVHNRVGGRVFGLLTGINMIKCYFPTIYYLISSCWQYFRVLLLLFPFSLVSCNHCCPSCISENYYKTVFQSANHYSRNTRSRILVDNFPKWDRIQWESGGGDWTHNPALARTACWEAMLGQSAFELNPGTMSSNIFPNHPHTHQLTPSSHAHHPSSQNNVDTTKTDIHTTQTESMGSLSSRTTTTGGHGRTGEGIQRRLLVTI